MFGRWLLRFCSQLLPGPWALQELLPAPPHPQVLRACSRSALSVPLGALSQPTFLGAPLHPLLPGSLEPLARPLVGFPQARANGRHFPGLGVACRTLQALPSTGRRTLCPSSPVPVSPPRCCKAVAWSPPPSPKDGPRRTPSPPVSSSLSRNEPRRLRSRRSRQARPATRAVKTECAVQGPTAPLRPLSVREKREPAFLPSRCLLCKRFIITLNEDS